MNVHHSHFQEKKKTRKSKAHTDSSSREESDGGGTEAPKRKRGRPRTVKRNDVEGFNDSEVRRFVHASINLILESIISHVLDCVPKMRVYLSQEFSFYVWCFTY